jgi:hypothetical protein
MTAPLALSLGLPAGASGSPLITVAPAHPAGAVPAVLAESNSTITRQNVYKPIKIRGPVVSAADCSTTDYTFTITNHSGAAQNVTYGKRTYVTIPKKTDQAFCAEQAATYTFGLTSNADAVLTVVSRR